MSACNSAYKKPPILLQHVEFTAVWRRKAVPELHRFMLFSWCLCFSRCFVYCFSHMCCCCFVCCFAVVMAFMPAANCSTNYYYLVTHQIQCNDKYVHQQSRAVHQLLMHYVYGAIQRFQSLACEMNPWLTTPNLVVTIAGTIDGTKSDHRSKTYISFLYMWDLVLGAHAITLELPSFPFFDY